MLRVGLVGLGFMGRGHLQNYQQLEKEGYFTKLVAVCDVRPELMGEKAKVEGNLAVGAGNFDFSGYAKYESLDDMIASENLDALDIALPTYLHAEAAIKGLNAGLHVICEKPMALNPEECTKMIEARDRSGKKLMIAQCLRFWPMYVRLKEAVDSREFGEVTSAYFFRGGDTPKWSFENWLLIKEKSGGVLLDQHVHDIDTINWLFGMPEKVYATGKNVIPGSGFDTVSTNYIYKDGKTVNAQDDWTFKGKFGFEMTFRVNFEKGAMVLGRDGLTIYPEDGDGYKPELQSGDGYYHELHYFYDAVKNDTPITVCAPESTRDTIRMACAEIESAEKGAPVSL